MPTRFVEFPDKLKRCKGFNGKYLTSQTPKPHISGQELGKGGRRLCPDLRWHGPRLSTSTMTLVHVPLAGSAVHQLVYQVAGMRFCVRSVERACLLIGQACEQCAQCAKARPACAQVIFFVSQFLEQFVACKSSRLTKCARELPDACAKRAHFPNARFLCVSSLLQPEQRGMPFSFPLKSSLIPCVGSFRSPPSHLWARCSRRGAGPWRR